MRCCASCIFVLLSHCVNDSGAWLIFLNLCLAEQIIDGRRSGQGATAAGGNLIDMAWVPSFEGGESAVH